MIIPHYFQKDAVKSVFNYFEVDKKKGNPLVCMPTGTGKSVVIADLIMQIFSRFPSQRILMLTHVWKLIQQNATRMQEFWPTAPIGIHSAGLGARDTMMPLIIGGVQSVAKNPKALGWRDLILIDEAHLLSPNDDTQYGQVIRVLTEINPKLKVIGFTATPYRLKMGMLTEPGGLFSDICYDITDFENFNRLISEGFMAPLIGKPTETYINTNNLHLQAGDFNQKEVEALIDTDEITYAAVQETIRFGGNRNSWMGFAAGVKNAEHIAATFNSFGIPSAAVHSKLTDEENRERLAAFERGELRNIVGANMLTTGYDNRKIDLIYDMQPTCSPGKHVQKLGRGTRVSPTKDNCLILDFAGNIGRNGPINDPVRPRKPGEKGGDAPIKFCETIRLAENKGKKPENFIQGCGAYNHAAARYCCNCAAEFTFSTEIYQTAKTDLPMKMPEAPKIEIVDVKNVTYSRHDGKLNASLGIISPPTVKATYILGLRPVSVYLCFEHTGKARRIAHEWWKMHHAGTPPETVTEFLSVSSKGELRVPKRVQVQVNLKFPTIEDYEF